MLIVGMNPGTGTAHDGPAFVGSRSGRFLADLCGAGDDSHLPERFTLVNLFTDEVGTTTSARKRAAALSDAARSHSYDVVVLCGGIVATAFDHREGVFVPVTYDVDGWVHERVRVPHPSGLCRTWNDQAARDAGRELFTRLWKDAA